MRTRCVNVVYVARALKGMTNFALTPGNNDNECPADGSPNLLSKILQKGIPIVMGIRNITYPRRQFKFLPENDAYCFLPWNPPIEFYYWLVGKGIDLQHPHGHTNTYVEENASKHYTDF
uniref:Uncharacterized protein n=1 Tax=Meloidogyne enterolobii TaxID=390850 RepID=A0A6V7W5X5_MELEN|nr:unnamed protein product [Meloidogyne enterolobii]